MKLEEKAEVTFNDWLRKGPRLFRAGVEHASVMSSRGGVSFRLREMERTGRLHIFERPNGLELWAIDQIATLERPHWRCERDGDRFSVVACVGECWAGEAAANFYTTPELDSDANAGQYLRAAFWEAVGRVQGLIWAEMARRYADDA